jgi:hypothetical protein
MHPQENRLIAIFAIALLLIVAATISYFISAWMGAAISCVDKGCSSTVGMTLSLLWGAVAVCVVTIWNRCR